jgi:hypothetical protein
MRRRAFMMIMSPRVSRHFTTFSLEIVLLLVAGAILLILLTVAF